MSTRRKHPRPAPPNRPPKPDETREGIWVYSDPSPTGGYLCVIGRGTSSATATPLTALDRHAAIRWAAAMIETAVRARYDAGVLAQLTAIGTDPAGAFLVIDRIRRSRAPVPAADTHPIRLTPIVSHLTRGPIVRCEIDGGDGWQWDATTAENHAFQVLTTSAATDLDSLYHAALTDEIDLDDLVARQVVAGLSQHITDREEWQ